MRGKTIAIPIIDDSSDDASNNTSPTSLDNETPTTNKNESYGQKRSKLVPTPPPSSSRSLLSNSRSTSSFSRTGGGHHHTRIIVEIGKKDKTLTNFLLLSVLYAISHSTFLTFMGVATSEFGDLGARSNGIVFFTYGLSAVMGATYVVKTYGARNSLLIGFNIANIYLSCITVASMGVLSPLLKGPVVIFGSVAGGVALGIAWTAQGAYFARAAREYTSIPSNNTILPHEATSMFAAIFSFAVFLGEAFFRILPTFLVEQYHVSWTIIFGSYTVCSVIAAFGYVYVHEYQPTEEELEHLHDSAFTKATAAWRLFWEDDKMKYMTGLNAIYGFMSAFMLSFVNGEVVRQSFPQHDTSSTVSILLTVTSAVAALTSLIVDDVSHYIGKGLVVVSGICAYYIIVFLFVIHPELNNWGWSGLIPIFVLNGVARSVFESTLRSEFADFFPYEPEGAFANIPFQNGLFAAVGFFLSISFTCKFQDDYCVEYQDGDLHNTLAFELICMTIALLAILGHWRASNLFEQERFEEEKESLSRTDEVKLALV